jgi:hypothetical protein
MLLEHDKGFAWNEDKLRKFILEEHSNRLRVITGRDVSTWMMQDGAVFQTEMDIVSQ